MSLLERLQRRRPPLLGIDISSTGIRLLELSKNKAKYQVERYASMDLPPDSVSERTIKDANAVGQLLQQLVRSSGSKAKYAAVAVPSSMVITKVLTMPDYLSEQQMSDQIELEAEQHIPYAMNEVNMDFSIIGRTEHTSDRVNVLLVASRSDNVNNRVTALTQAQLTPKVVDVESYAIEAACGLIFDPQTHGDELIAVFDIGDHHTTLHVVHKGNTIFTREQPYGGRQLTEQIQAHYGLSLEDALNAKRSGNLPENYERTVLEPFKQELTNQIGHALRFFVSSGQHDHIDRIVLSGGNANLPGLALDIHEATGVETTIANPFAHMSYTKQVDIQRLHAEAPGLMVACGLAMRGLH